MGFFLHLSNYRSVFTFLLISRPKCNALIKLASNRESKALSAALCFSESAANKSPAASTKKIKVGGSFSLMAYIYKLVASW